MINRCFQLWFAARVITNAAIADGMAFKYRPDLSTAQPLAENEQMAIIAQRDGRQQMLLAVSFDDLKTDDRAVWIVPIPGTPETVKIDIADRVPQFFGRDVLSLANAERDKVLTLASLFAILPICLRMPSLSADGLSIEHAEVTKHGLRVATVTPTSVDDLVAYFGEHKVAVEPAMLQSLTSYLNERHTLIVGWIASRAELLREYPLLAHGSHAPAFRPGISVEFSTEVPFFPLIPTSFYGDLPVPLRLIVGGFHQPPADIGWSSHTVRWCRATRIDAPETRDFFGIGPSDSLDYTVVRTDVPAREYTRDLRLEPATASELRAALWTLAHLPGRRTSLYILLVVALASYVAGGVTGLLFFGRWHRLSLFGLTNLLTVLGMMLCVRTVNFSEISPWWPTTHDNVKRRCFVVGFVLIYTFAVPLIGIPLLRLIA